MSFLVGLFWSYVLPWLLDKLVEAGVLEAEKITGIKTVEDLIGSLKELKTYPDYDIQKNGEKAVKMVARGQPNSNINQ